MAPGTLAADAERTLDSAATERVAAVTRVSGGNGRHTRLLIVSPGAKNLSDAAQRTLDAAFSGYVQIEFNPRHDFAATLTSNATVVVAGGDGTVGTVVRALAGTHRRLGILPLGTFNNFARSLAIPAGLDRAIAVVRAGVTRPVTLGRINGRYFLEAAAVGVFGEAIVLGEKAKDRAFGELAAELGAVAKAELFSFETHGAFAAHGRSRSLVFTNTPTTGARLPIAGTDPTDPFLELNITVGASRSDIVRRVVASTVGGRHSDDDGISFQFRSLTITTKPRIGVVADNERIGRTPATVEAVPGALRVIVPA
ncbi:MAG: diacylglycerol kinase family protein [Candidatus Dormiibacterota bacterium]